MDFNINNEPYLENNNIEQINESNQNQTIWYIFSILSWFFFICCQLDSYLRILIFKSSEGVFNIQIFQLFILLISSAGLIIYLIFTSCKKNQNLYNSMLGKKTKFHFIPLLFASVLFIIKEIIQLRFYSPEFINRIIITDLVFSILTLAFLIFIYIQMNIPYEWYIVLTIKKGTFSCLIPWVLYLIKEDILFLMEIDMIYNGKVINIISHIIAELCSLLFSFIFKDILVAFTNVLIYISYLTFTFLYILFGSSENGILIFYVILYSIFILFSLFLIAFLSIKYKDKIFQ